MTICPTLATDVFVIGGGPAGLAAAIAARRRGFDVIVADRSEPPIDKACGEGIMPDGVAAARAFRSKPPARDPFAESVSASGIWPRKLRSRKAWDSACAAPRCTN
jgi:flavin-dependent dehydrogenase